MQLIDYSFDEPAANLALDELLLEAVECAGAPSTLRLWESPRHFVVLGTAQAVAAEVHEAACKEAGIPVLRRCSAGGCVLQGPGCLNYALALRYDLHPDLKGLHASYTWILNRIATALAPLGITAVLSGISDLSRDGMKFSGNAQRRRRVALLHHGTLLYQTDPALMARVLQEPADRPDYRGARRHADFVTPLPVAAPALREAVCRAFGLDPAQATTPDAAALAAADALARSKYLDPAWIYRR